MRALLALGSTALLLFLSGCGPNCQSTCQRIYGNGVNADAIEDCAIQRPGRTQGDLIDTCMDNCENALDQPGELGTYDPMAAVFDLDEEAALQWLRNGAQMSETVHDLLKSKGTLAKYAGEEGVEKEGALSHDKPKRHKKLASSSAPAAEEAATEPPAEGEATDES